MSRIVIADKEFDLYLPSEKIQQQIEIMANRMNNELKSQNVIFIGVLNGAFMFAADLLKRIHLNVQISFMKVSSYRGTASGMDIKRLIGLNDELKGKTVVILEDIIDSGKTIADILYQLKGFRPSEIQIAALLFKTESYKGSLNIDYVGFEIPDRFVVGYGLDYCGFGRNLRNIYMVKEGEENSRSTIQ
jgi:hypoxanthine phosphoribosyltransferase